MMNTGPQSQQERKQKERQAREENHKYESGGDTNYNFSPRNGPQTLGEKTSGIGNWRIKRPSKLQYC